MPLAKAMRVVSNANADWCGVGHAATVEVSGSISV
jgi:hypothetical protein